MNTIHSSNDNNYRPSQRQEAAKRREFFDNIVHSEQFAIQVGVTSEDGDQNVAFSTTTNAVGTKSIQPNEILLQCALVNVCNPIDTKFNRTCVLFDSCSQRTYITTELQNRLQLTYLRAER